MPKFCVLLEDYHEGAATLMVGLTTSRLEFLRYPTAVRIADGTFADISGDSCLQCDNLLEVEARILVSGSHSKYLGQLPEPIMLEVDAAVERVEATEHIFVRILGLE